MVGVATADDRRVSVMGTLDETTLVLLTSAIEKGNVVLDLSEVTDADESTVSLLARLPAGRCSFVGSPPWLAQRVERRLIEFANGVW